MDRATRKNLKTDKFAAEVGHTVEYIGEHRKGLYRWGGIALAVIVVAAATYWYMAKQQAERQVALSDALRTMNAAVGPSPNPSIKTFSTEQEKDQAIQKEFTALATKGGAEATIANYLLGVYAADKGNLAEAEKFLKIAADGGNSEYASLAKLSLSDLYVAQGKTADAEKLLRDLLAKPTTLVSKSQATLSLARILSRTNPGEAQKLLEPLRTETGAVGQAAITALGDLAKK